MRPEKNFGFGTWTLLQIATRRLTRRISAGRSPATNISTVKSEGQPPMYCCWLCWINNREHRFSLWCEMVADICSGAAPLPSPGGVWEEERQKQNNCGVAAMTGRAFNSPQSAVTSDWRTCSRAARRPAPTARSQMTIGQASLRQKLITIMEHKVWLSGQIVNDKSVLPSRTSYVRKTGWLSL